MFQSTSSVILEHFEALVRSHPIVIYFLTMLVGAGGNAGSQSTVLVVRQLAVAAARGESPLRGGPAVHHILGTQVSVGARLALVLFVASYVRCVCFQVRGAECLAICLSMLAITFVSTVVGASLPLLLNRLGFDPAHAQAAIQVVMDILGVTLTCVISCTVLGVQVSKNTPLAPIVTHTAGVDGARLPGIQHEGVYQLNGFGSFASGPKLDGG